MEYAPDTLEWFFSKPNKYKHVAFAAAGRYQFDINQLAAVGAHEVIIASRNMHELTRFVYWMPEFESVPHVRPLLTAKPL
jgi:hypothetical protein